MKEGSTLLGKDWASVNRVIPVLGSLLPQLFDEGNLIPIPDTITERQGNDSVCPTEGSPVTPHPNL